MSKFKIEKGVSRINRVKLQATIEESIAADLALLGEWSNNDKNYIVNELLRFALPRTASSRRTKSLSAPRAQNQDRQGRSLRAATSSIGGQGPASGEQSRALVLGYSGGNLVSQMKTLCRILVRHRFCSPQG